MLALLESGVQMFSDVFSLGKALFSFHCAFKDSIDSLILGVFLLDYVHICCWSPACRKSRRSWPRMPRVPRAKNHEEGNHDRKRWVAMIGSICSFFFWYVKIQYISYKIS